MRGSHRPADAYIRARWRTRSRVPERRGRGSPTGAENSGVIPPQIVQHQLAAREDARLDVPDMGFDRRVAVSAGDGHAVVAVLDEVHFSDPVGVDGGIVSPRRRAAAIVCQRPCSRRERGRNSRSNSPLRRSTVPTIESRAISRSPRSCSETLPRAATTSPEGSSANASWRFLVRREATRARHARRRWRANAVLASDSEKPVTM